MTGLSASSSATAAPISTSVCLLSAFFTSGLKTFTTAMSPSFSTRMFFEATG